MFDDSNDDDFDDDDLDDDEFDEEGWTEEWDEEDWENFFRQEDERKRRLQALLDKYGFSEEGLRKAFEEMGYYLPEKDENFDDADDPEEIDDILARENQSWESEITEQDQLQNAHPLFQSCYQFVLKIMKSLQHLQVEQRDHPLIIFQTGLFECMSKIIQAGYDDIDSKLEAERGLILAALKRARQALLMSLLTIPSLEALNIFTSTTITVYRHQITDLLKLINQEILLNKKEP